MWRWDQGRLTYFQFDYLKQIAKCLVELDGVLLNVKDHDPLREHFVQRLDLPFSPEHYKVWRNYKRVFECSFLATAVEDRLVISDICRKVAGIGEQEIDVDEYLSLLIPRFCFPFPAFQEYDHRISPIYPFCSILKYLIASLKYGKLAALDENDVFSIIVGNNCNGCESIEYYSELRPVNCFPKGDQKRQVREMLIFLSQLTILKWFNQRLHLDISQSDLSGLQDLTYIITPIIRQRKALQTEEFMSMTSIMKEVVTRPSFLPSREIPTEEIFTEGKRVRRTHLKIERSPILRRLFFQVNRNPICHMCECDTKKKYPWSGNLLEMHHILPLSSTLAVSLKGTSLEDVVALCPTCHRATHDYYKNWLDVHLSEDFQTKAEARQIYAEAKSQVRL